MDYSLKEVAGRIKDLREAKGYTPEELAKLTGEEKYHAAALKLLYGLHTLCADYSDRCTGVLQKCTAAYHNDGAGRHINILYGDYFYLEALCKLAGHDARLWMCE